MIVERKPFRNCRSVQVQMLILLAWISGFQGLLLVVALADFRVVKHTDGNLTLLISGTISDGNTKARQGTSADLERDHLTIYLDSRGGDVVVAMQIGRLIRKYEGTTFIGHDLDDGSDPLNANVTVAVR